MHLNKEICKRCLNNTPTPWNMNDDNNWKSGLVTCPTESVDRVTMMYTIQTISMYETKCRYKAEHLILDNMNDTTKTTESI